MTGNLLTKKQVQHLARLAHLTLTDVEIETYQEQLSSIIGYISKLNELNTDNVDEASQIIGLTNVLRDDKTEISRVLTQEKALSNKTNSKNGRFEVDAVFQNNE